MERLPARWLASDAVLTLLGVLAGGFAVRRLDRAPALEPIHFAVPMSFGDDVLQQASGVVISPDGTRIVSAGSQGGQDPAAEHCSM